MGLMDTFNSVICLDQQESSVKGRLVKISVTTSQQVETFLRFKFMYQ